MLCALSWRPIEEYIDGAYEQYFKDECGLNRKNITDNRVHCVLYFLPPHIRGLRPVRCALLHSPFSFSCFCFVLLVFQV